MLLDELTEAFLAGNQHTFQANTLRAYRSDLAMLAGMYLFMSTEKLPTVLTESLTTLTAHAKRIVDHPGALAAG